MNSLEQKFQKARFRTPIIIAFILFAVIVYWCFFTSLTASDKTQYVYIDNDDTIDSVFHKVNEAAMGNNITGFTTLMRHTKYAENINTGRYAIKPGEMVVTVFRKIKNGRQESMNLTITPVRTVERLAEQLSEKLMASRTDFLNILCDEEMCEKYGYTPETVMCMFIPNTYDVYWNISPEKLMERMQKESKAFWNDTRKGKAQVLNLSPVEVMTLASIIDEETANDQEKPMIAGMYYNRLQAGMPLQADPTVKFAMKNFEAKRIYRGWLTFNSPFNTYKNTGLPPGPIRIPSVAGIDAVLNMAHHKYMYMCAKEDFSGTHNFAVTYAEHQQNAAKYSAALNARGIK